ncbi:neurochondrin [Discoglossus pictus]
MTSRLEPTADQDDHPGNPALERCLGILKTAKNDSEQFAALLLVTKCARAGELDEQTRHRIFEAVGFSFPNRLLFSKSIPEGCSSSLFRGLGVTLLACFCTDPSLAEHPHMLNKIHIFNETVNTPCQPGKEDITSMVEDAYQCIVGIMATPHGPRHLVSSGTVSSLCQAYLNRNHKWEKAMDILITLLTYMPEKCWKKSCPELQLLLAQLSKDFYQKEDTHKFYLAEVLPVFLPPTAVLLERSWGRECLRHLCKGLLNILSSKLSTSQRDPALKLAACLAHTYGSSWICTGDKNIEARLLALLVNLACVEIRMTLEDLEPPDSRQASVTACYSLVEMGIQECTKNEERTLLGDEQKLQLMQVMQEACGAVIYYLQQLGQEKIEDPFVLASVRLLGAWLAEETSCLKQEVIKLLPFLMHYMKTWYQRGMACRNLPKEESQGAILTSSWGGMWPGDAIRFLLPALCHLSAEEAPRRVLISEGAPALLCDYFQQQWEVFSAEEESAGTQSAAELSLQTCCGVFLNLVVTEPTLIGPASCFATLLKLLIQCLPTLLHKQGHLVLAANFATLGLMMSRLLVGTAVLQEDISQNFFTSVIQFLSQSHLASNDLDTEETHVTLSAGYEDAWEEISELWFLGVQAFASCVPLLPWLSALVLESGWLKDILRLLAQVIPSSVDSDLVMALNTLLSELARSSVPCRELIRKHGGAEKANLYGMAALEQCLSELP